jgi:hypothetical protein
LVSPCLGGNPCLCSPVKSELVAAVLNVGGIGGARRGDGVDSAAGRAAADVGFQYEGGAAPPAIGGKATTGDRSLTQGAAVGLRHKLHQFPPLGKRPTTSVPMTMPAAASTSRHIESPLNDRCFSGSGNITDLSGQLPDLGQ